MPKKIRKIIIWLMIKIIFKKQNLKMNMKKIIFGLIFIALFVFINTELQAAIFHIEPDSLLKYSKTIKYVKVHTYTDTTMSVQYKNRNFTFKFRPYVIFKDIRRQLMDNSQCDDLYGRWPNIGDSILLVADSNNAILLLAFKRSNYFRFWDPYYTIDVRSLFICTVPALPILSCIKDKKPWDDGHFCIDGFLYPIDLITEK